MALHGSLPFLLKRQMAVLSAVVEALVRPMLETGCHFGLCRTVGTKLSCVLIASLLQDFFENGAMLIDRAPEPEFVSSTFPQLHEGSD